MNPGSTLPENCQTPKWHDVWFAFGLLWFAFGLPLVWFPFEWRSSKNATLDEPPGCETPNLKSALLGVIDGGHPAEPRQLAVLQDS